MDKKKLISKVKEILEGIDQTQIESGEDGHGYWETSVGAEFGTKKLQEVISAIDAA